MVVCNQLYIWQLHPFDKKVPCRSGHFIVTPIFTGLWPNTEYDGFSLHVSRGWLGHYHKAFHEVGKTRWIFSSHFIHLTVWKALHLFSIFCFWKMFRETWIVPYLHSIKADIYTKSYQKLKRAYLSFRNSLFKTHPVAGPRVGDAVERNRLGVQKTWFSQQTGSRNVRSIHRSVIMGNWWQGVSSNRCFPSQGLIWRLFTDGHF